MGQRLGLAGSHAEQLGEVGEHEHLGPLGDRALRVAVVQVEHDDRETHGDGAQRHGAGQVDHCKQRNIGNASLFFQIRCH